MKDFKLDNEPKISSGFQIPDNYFDDFSSKLSKDLFEKEVKAIPLFQRRKKWLIAVAAVVLIALFIPMDNFTQDEYTALDESTLENYITNHSTINQYDLIGLLDTKDINNIQIENNFEDQAIEDALYNSDLEEILTE